MGDIAELALGDRNLRTLDQWPESCQGSLRYPRHLDCGECGGVITKGEVAYVVKGSEARTVYCSRNCAQLNGCVDPPNY